MPAVGVDAVVLNVTVTQPTAQGFLTVFPSGTAWPLASNLNFLPNQTIPNLVVAKVGADGKVSIYNHAGASHVIFDVVGWFAQGPGVFRKVGQVLLQGERVSASITRVLIESRDQSGARWWTVGVSDNIIDASFQALMDSIVYKLMKNRDLAGQVAAE